MTAIYFSSHDLDKVITISKNTYYSFSIFIFGGFLTTSLILKVFKSSFKNKNKEELERKKD